MAQYEPFREGDDFDELADRLRRDVAGLVLKLQDNLVYRRLSLDRQVEVVMAGLTTGLVGCLFSMTHKYSHNDLVELITDYIPQAAALSDGIRGDD